jgi:hypothetical protein
MTALHRIILLAALVTSGPAAAQYTDGVVKIGVLTDMEKLEEAGLSARTP